MSRLNAASNVHDLRGFGKHNVSHLIYVPLIAPNTYVNPTAIVSSNHEFINQSYTVSTEAVCNSRKTTCSSPCTISSNVNNMSTSTSDKLPSKALKTTDIVNYFNDFFIGKIRKLRDDMPATNADTTHPSILDQIYERQELYIWIPKVSVEEVKKWLLPINNDKPPGSDNLDGKLLSGRYCHIYCICLLESVCPQAGREAKVIPLPKNSKAVFTGSNSRPISLLPTSSKLFEKIVND